MKNNDSLNFKLLEPKRKTINFILNYSKGISILKIKDKSFILLKN